MKKILKHFVLLFLAGPVLYMNGWSQPINDVCEGAIDISSLIGPNNGFYSIDGTTVDANPENLSNACGIGDFPTVWYRFYVFPGTNINISVSSNSIFTPAISLFSGDCGSLEPELLDMGMVCATGTNGSVTAMNKFVYAPKIYFLAVTSTSSSDGEFTLFVSGVLTGTHCVLDADITVVQRSEPGPLYGPFKPGEQVTFSMNVNKYTAAENGCQWFQGLVPTFGDGWDTNSFDMNGQPLNAQINDKEMGQWMNGNYHNSTWDWFTDVDYHYPHQNFQVGDFDGNGILEICNNLYDPNCPSSGGLKAACCGPCWDLVHGTVLPGGWFAYGNNGTCGLPAPPIGYDWGDGNSCGVHTEPWRISFDLLVNERELLDEGYNKLSLGFVTFADGEIGSWTGGESVCALDQPKYIEFDVDLRSLGRDTADIQGSTKFSYTPNETDIVKWTAISLPDEITLEKYWTANGETMIFHLEEGNHINDEYIISLVGVPEFGFGVTKELFLSLCPAYNLDLPNVVKICKNYPRDIQLVPAQLSGFTYQWLPGGESGQSLTLPSNSSLNEVTLTVFNERGCVYHDTTSFVVENCKFEVTNDKPEEVKIENTPFQNPKAETRSLPPSHELVILPNPAKESILIDWGKSLEEPSQIHIFDLNGREVHSIFLKPQTARRISVDISHFPEGQYIVVMKNTSIHLTKKMVKF